MLAVSDVTVVIYAIICTRFVSIDDAHWRGIGRKSRFIDVDECYVL